MEDSKKYLVIDANHRGWQDSLESVVHEAINKRIAAKYQSAIESSARWFASNLTENERYEKDFCKEILESLKDQMYSDEGMQEVINHNAKMKHALASVSALFSSMSELLDELSISGSGEKTKYLYERMTAINHILEPWGNRS